MKSYNKLVRDKIPNLIASQGITAKTRVLEDAEYIKKLKEKLNEELTEVLEADPEKVIEELADLTEVIYALAAANGWDKEGLEKVRLAKLAKRGGFDERILLISTE